MDNSKITNIIAEYFDKNVNAFNYDQDRLERIDLFLDNFNLKGYEDVLDVGCGSGIIDGYLARNNKYIDSIDLSKRMIETAKSIHKEENLRYFNENYYEFHENKKYDLIIIFNAYPHFLDKEKFKLKSKALLKENGRLIILHDVNRNRLKELHLRACDKISRILEEAEVEAKVYKDSFKIVNIEDNENKFVIDMIKNRD